MIPVLMYKSELNSTSGIPFTCARYDILSAPMEATPASESLLELIVRLTGREGFMKLEFIIIAFLSRSMCDSLSQIL